MSASDFSQGLLSTGYLSSSAGGGPSRNLQGDRGEVPFILLPASFAVAAIVATAHPNGTALVVATVWATVPACLREQLSGDS